MGHAVFNSPLTVTLPEGKDCPRASVIDGPRAGLAAMTQHGLGGYEMGADDWRVAFGALVRAVLEPTPENLARARDALELLDARHSTRH